MAESDPHLTVNTRSFGLLYKAQTQETRDCRAVEIVKGPEQISGVVTVAFNER